MWQLLVVVLCTMRINKIIKWKKSLNKKSRSPLSTGLGIIQSDRDIVSGKTRFSNVIFQYTEQHQLKSINLLCIGVVAQMDISKPNLDEPTIIKDD